MRVDKAPTVCLICVGRTIVPVFGGGWRCVECKQTYESPVHSYHVHSYHVHSGAIGLARRLEEEVAHEDRDAPGTVRAHVRAERITCTQEEEAAHEAATLAFARSLVKKFYPRMADNYSGRRLQIVLEALKQERTATVRYLESVAQKRSDRMKITAILNGDHLDFID